jgi:stage II sporulation protein D
VARLRLLPGDRVRWHADQAGRADVLELRPPVKGVADDRSAAVYAWEVRKTRRELEEAIGKRVRVGTLRDLKVVRRGVSGRIVALEVVGSRGRQTVRGFDVRNLLDLRETLAAFEIQRDRAGEITAVSFHGKGWGHGVGLCQVGAYGMALRGEGYRAILAHYYPGTTISSAP